MYESPLEPLLDQLASTFDTGENLTGRIDDLFDQFDTDSTGALSFTELSEGMFKYKSVRLQFEDFDRLTDSGILCNNDQELDLNAFRAIVLKQLKKFIQRKLADALYLSSMGADMNSLITTMKFVMVDLEHMQQEVINLRSDLGRQTIEIHMKLDQILSSIAPADISETNNGCGVQEAGSDQPVFMSRLPAAAVHPPLDNFTSLTSSIVFSATQPGSFW